MRLDTHLNSRPRNICPLKLNSAPCDFISATLPILAMVPPTPCVFTTPIRSKLFRLNQSNSKLIRLSRKPIDDPILSSCFFSYVIAILTKSNIGNPDSASPAVGRQGLYEL